MAPHLNPQRQSPTFIFPTEHSPTITAIPTIANMSTLHSLTHKNWNDSLATKNWESLGQMENVNEMALAFSNLINDALDEIALLKTFTIKEFYKAGLSNEAKSLMKERDFARKNVKLCVWDPLWIPRLW